MAVRTSLCDLLGVVHPLLSAPMALSAGPVLVAAVSAAGGFGLLGGSRTDGPTLRKKIRTVRELTDKPFGVGFVSSAPDLSELTAVAIEERVALIAHSFADPTPFVGEAHAAGILLAAQVQTVAQARTAADAGVDVVAAQGTEAGGHTGYSATLPLVPAVIDAVGDIPVVAAGGIADGRGVAAALMLGADGVWLGSRFVASVESVQPDWIKRRALTAGTDDTVLTKAFDLAMQAPFPAGIADRVIRNDYTDTWHGRDAEVIAQRARLNAEIQQAIKDDNQRIVAARVGNAAGLIHTIEPAGDIVRSIMAEAETLLRERPRKILGEQL
jgi:nitronate monooxygenase